MKYYFVIAALLVLVITYQACNKQNEPVAKGKFLEIVRDVSYKHGCKPNSHLFNSRTEIDEGQEGATVFGTLVNDAVGTWTGASWGFEIGLCCPPYGPFIGSGVAGLLMGWSSSGLLLANKPNSQYYILPTIEPLTADAFTIDITNGISIGEIHNEFLNEVATNHNAYFNNDGTLKLGAIYDYTLSYYDGHFSGDYEYEEYVMPKDTFIQNFCSASCFCSGKTYAEMLTDYEEAGIINSLEMEFSTVFLETLSEEPEIEEVYDYCKELLILIDEDEEMTEIQKHKLIQFLNIGYYSYAYWYTNLN